MQCSEIGRDWLYLKAGEFKRAPNFFSILRPFILGEKVEILSTVVMK